MSHETVRRVSRLQTVPAFEVSAGFCPPPRPAHLWWACESPRERLSGCCVTWSWLGHQRCCLGKRKDITALGSLRAGRRNLILGKFLGFPEIERGATFAPAWVTSKSLWVCFVVQVSKSGWGAWEFSQQGPLPLPVKMWCPNKHFLEDVS